MSLYDRIKTLDIAAGGAGRVEVAGVSLARERINRSHFFLPSSIPSETRIPQVTDLPGSAAQVGAARQAAATKHGANRLAPHNLPAGRSKVVCLLCWVQAHRADNTSRMPGAAHGHATGQPSDGLSGRVERAHDD